MRMKKISTIIFLCVVCVTALCVASAEAADGWCEKVRVLWTGDRGYVRIKFAGNQGTADVTSLMLEGEQITELKCPFKPADPSTCRIWKIMARHGMAYQGGWDSGGTITSLNINIPDCKIAITMDHNTGKAHGFYKWE